MAVAEATPFATTKDLELFYSSYSDAIKDRAEAYLASVSHAIMSLCEWEDVDPEILKLVTIQATIRVLQAGSETPIGVTQQSWSASPFSGSLSFSNPSGDIYFTAFEKKLLGVDASDAGFINFRLGDGCDS